MTTFEDRLLAELRQVVADRPEPAAVQPPLRRAPRARIALGGFATAAAAAAAVVIASGGDPAEPAYAVDRQSDGSVTVQISSLRDADGLERKLRAAGIPAVVDYTPAGKMCRMPRGKPAQIDKLTMSGTARDSGPATFTFERGQIKPGQTVVIQSSLGEGASSIGTEIVEGPVAACELVDAPSVPAGPGASTGGGRHGVASGGGVSAVAGTERSVQTGP
jgi:hypothetical protein